MIEKIDITKLKYYTDDSVWSSTSSSPSYCIGILDDDYVIEITYKEISLIKLGSETISHMKNPNWTSQLFIKGEKIESYNFSQVIKHNLLPGIISSDTKFRIMKSLQVIGNITDYKNFVIYRERDRKLLQLI